MVLHLRKFKSPLATAGSIPISNVCNSIFSQVAVVYRRALENKQEIAYTNYRDWIHKLDVFRLVFSSGTLSVEHGAR